MGSSGCGFIQDGLWGSLTPVCPWVRCALWTRGATSSVAKGASTLQVPQPRPAKALPEQHLPQASAVLLFISLRLFLLTRSLMAARARQPGVGLSVAPWCGTGLRHRLAPALPSLHRRSFGKRRATSRAAQGRNETSGSSRCKPKRLCAREVPKGLIPGLSVQYSDALGLSTHSSAPSSPSQSQVPVYVIPSQALQAAWSHRCRVCPCAPCPRPCLVAAGDRWLSRWPWCGAFSQGPHAETWGRQELGEGLTWGETSAAPSWAMPHLLAADGEPTVVWLLNLADFSGLREGKTAGTPPAETGGDAAWPSCTARPRGFPL